MNDAAGNMTLAPRPGDEASADEALVLVYDACNRLVAAYADNEADGVADAGELIVIYEYDGLNRRTEKSLEGDPDVTYDYYYSTQWQVVEVRKDDDADLYEQLVWGTRYVDDLAIRYYDPNTTGTPQTQYILNDAMFNVTALTDSSGTVSERYTYAPYGQRTVLAPNWSEVADGESDYAMPYGHQGLRHDPETGLVENRNRMRHVTLGRWMQRDPVGYPDGMNAYGAYHVIHGGVDPSGMEGGLGPIGPLPKPKGKPCCPAQVKAHTRARQDCYVKMRDEYDKARKAARDVYDMAISEIEKRGAQRAKDCESIIDPDSWLYVEAVYLCKKSVWASVGANKAAALVTYEALRLSVNVAFLEGMAECRKLTPCAKGE